ncbi:AfsR/SARP family transcriptional regulator [Streptomyces sp. NPDC086549]|uniref:AfsR/SARP family transcriptional regulator n=1 Tax=Streptomyces sp. NPDC086549 TaxID=3365752 RepID=UPI0037FAE3D9
MLTLTLGTDPSGSHFLTRYAESHADRSPVAWAKGDCGRARWEQRITLDLRGGRAERCVRELTELVAADPLRERSHVLLMEGLNREGKRADALAAFRHARRILADELGVEPGPELAALHQSIVPGAPARRSPPRRIGRPKATMTRPRPAALPHRPRLPNSSPRYRTSPTVRAKPPRVPGRQAAVVLAPNVWGVWGTDMRWFSCRDWAGLGAESVRPVATGLRRR